MANGYIPYRPFTHVQRALRNGKRLLCKGIKVKIGVLDNMFVATPRVRYDNSFDELKWNITHIPSGYCYDCRADSPEEAVSIYERKIKTVGKLNYQRELRRIMKTVRKC